MPHRTLMLLACLLTACTAFAQLEDLKTVAEASDYTRTMSNEQVLDYCQELAALSPKVTFSQLGTTDGGNPIPLLIVGDPPPLSPAALRLDGRIPVYIQANIHGGEVEGKEATLILARDLAAGRYPEVLEKAVVLIVPNYNADGNSHIDPQNRYYQAGPDAVGRRQNDRNLDLNRDWIKLEAAETRAVVEHILNKWDPALIVDCHTTNGSLHKEPMTWEVQTHPSGNQAVREYARTVLVPAAAELTLSEYGLSSIPYGNFLDRQDRSKGWITFGHHARYTTNYTGLRNRLSVLLESYVYAPYKDRVWATYGFLRGMLEHAALNRDEITALLADAGARAWSRTTDDTSENGSLALTVEPVAIKGETVTIETWEGGELYEDDQGRRRIRPTGAEITLTVPHYGAFKPTKSTTVAGCYVIDAAETMVIKKLQQHGIALFRLTEDTEIPTEQFIPASITRKERANQGHAMTHLEGEWQSGPSELKAGSVIVPTAQPLGMLAAYLLEPENDDGLTAWNYFDHRLYRQWGSQPLPHPVLRIPAAHVAALPLKHLKQ